MRGKTDANHSKIVDDLRQMGYSVRSIADLKRACDLIVTDGRSVKLFEVKNPKTCRGIEGMDYVARIKFLTKGEKEFAESFPVHVVCTAYEIDRVFKTSISVRDLIEIDR